MKKEITYKSKDNITDIHASIWIPDGEIKCILQISHGMLEHIDRYDEFAENLNKKGILVCGNDHLGHGLSVIDKEHYGYFASKNARQILINDVYELTTIIKKDYPNIPYFMLGHSFGSFIARNYLTSYSESLTGIIITGTAHHSKLKLIFAKCLTKIISFYKTGPFYRSKFLYKCTTGNYKKYFKNNENNSWLTKDKDYLVNFIKDPRCTFKFTCNGYHTMFDLILHSNDKYKKIKKDLPILLLSGKDDPVGNFGKSITKINKIYKKRGLTNVKYKIYNGLRHALLNEVEKVIVINDITQFINNNCMKKENK